VKPTELFRKINEYKSGTYVVPLDWSKNCTLKKNVQEIKQQGKYIPFDEFLALDEPEKANRNFI
jgi:hypothetical protein